MRLDEYESYDALGLAALVQQGELTPRELLEVALARASARNPRRQRRRDPDVRGGAPRRGGAARPDPSAACPSC